MRYIIFLALLCPCLSNCQPITLKGKIINEQMEPVPGATIILKRSNNGQPPSVITQQSSDAKGEFTMTNLLLTDTLIISAVGYETAVEILDFNSRGLITIILKRRTSLLDEAVVIAYGTTSRRLNTGNVGKISSQQLNRQPVSNPLQALDGRIPGLAAVQGSGLPGAMVKIQVRGQSSLIQGSEPLFIIDGVPFAPGNGNVNQLPSALNSVGNAGLSPFNSLNTADIESIEVLKDADATAIYGSRGANGVVLITTKKGSAGKTAFTISLSSGISKASRIAPMLSTSQYLQMRREAFANDSLTATISNAPDLMVWDTTRYTNFSNLLLGGTARQHRALASLSGGNAQTNFLLSASWQKEITFFPGSLSNARGNMNLSLGHSSVNKKFSISLSALYGYNDNRLPATNLASFINLPPNAPPLYTPGGSLNWEEGGVSFLNPLAFSLRTYRAQASNLVSNLQLSLQIWKGLEFRSGLGYNRLLLNEIALTPIASQNPTTAPKGSSQFATNNISSWIAEPQLHYSTGLAGGRLTVMAGASYQKNFSDGISILAEEYTNDALLQSLAAAPSVSSRSNSVAQYRYAACFGRINYNWQSKYLVNLSVRRDGSSRFGPGRQWATFAAMGAGWLFSNEAFIKKALPFISYGKLRWSLGTAGNDQIGDYKYLDAWSSGQPYQDGTALYPSSLFNPVYSWEHTKKEEAAIELGFFKNKLLLNASLYRHRSSDQLLNYVLPAQTGFTGILSNFPATVQNSGWELEATSTNITGKNFSWLSSFNISFPHNQLLSFPGIANSSYYSTYMVGKPLNLIYRLNMQAVDPATGVFTFEDANKDGSISTPVDFVYSGHLAPQFFGGLGNDISYKNLSLSIFFVFKKQNGLNYLGSLYSASFVPGLMYNQPEYVLNRWQKPGDEAAIQRFTASTSGAAYAARTRLNNSNGVYSDASFVRLKTMELSLELPASLLKRIGLAHTRVYAQAQNLFTFTGYKGSDPETQNFYAMPPLKTLVAGIQITL